MFEKTQGPVKRALPAALGFVMLMAVVSVCFAQEKSAPKTPDASAITAGAQLYARHCALCHGSDLKGSGPFPPPYRVPPDLRTLARRHGGQFPSTYVDKVLRNGVTLPAHGPAEMPVWATTNRLDKAHLDEWIRNLTSYLKSQQVK